MDFAGIGKGFVGQYYTFFGSQREQCRGVYRPNSLMTWSGEQIAGVEEIMVKFAALTFGAANFVPQDIECHPTPGGGILVVVNGELQQPEEAHSLAFNDVFNLMPDEAGQWYVANQFFKVLGGGGQ
jgi:hypothetical protein